MLLFYLDTYPKAKIRFYAGNMILHIESDAAHLILLGICSRIVGRFYLHTPAHPNKLYVKCYNGPIHVKCSTITNAVSSAAEAECGGIFHNCTMAIGIQNTLNAIGYLQEKIEVITDIIQQQIVLCVQKCM